MQHLLIRLQVALTAPRLDAELAGGLPPEWSTRHALRADQLVAPVTRARLAGSWEALLARVRLAPAAATTRVPIRRERVVRAEPEIRQLVDALRTAGPVPAQGVALARRLLRDGTGPVYNRGSADTLPELLARAVEHLDPARPLTSDLLEAARD